VPESQDLGWSSEVVLRSMLGLFADLQSTRLGVHLGTTHLCGVCVCVSVSTYVWCTWVCVLYVVCGCGVGDVCVVHVCSGSNTMLCCVDGTF